jgi:hypothetical protein
MAGVDRPPTKLGVTFAGQCSVAQLQVQARRAEQIGFDVVMLIDHPGNAAALPPLVAMAAAAPSVRVGNLVINASFHLCYRSPAKHADIVAIASSGDEAEVADRVDYVKPGGRSA